MREAEAGRLLFLVRALLPLLLLALAVMLYEAYADFRSTLLDRASRQLRLDAAAGGRQFAELLREYHESLNLLAASPLLPRAADESGGAAGPLRQLLALHAGTVVAIELRTADDRVIAGSGPPLPAAPVRQPDATTLLSDGDHPLLLLAAPVPAGHGSGAWLWLALDPVTLAGRALAPLLQRDEAEVWLYAGDGRLLWQSRPGAGVPAASGADDLRLQGWLRSATAGSEWLNLTRNPDDPSRQVERLVGFEPLPAQAGPLVLVSAVDYRLVATPLDQFALQLLLIGSVLTLTLFAAAGVLLRLRASAERRERRLERLHALIGRVDQALFDCADADDLYAALAGTLAEPVPNLHAALAMRATDIEDARARELARQVLDDGLPRWHESGDDRSDAMLPITPHGRPVAVLWLRQSAAPPFDAAARRLVSRLAQDIGNALVRIDDRVRRAEAESDLRLVASVFENMREAAVITDADNCIVRVNPAFTTITGYLPAEVIGRTPTMLSSGRHGREFYATMWQSLAEHGSWSGEICNRRKDGCEYLEWLSISVVRTADGAIAHHVAVFADLTEHSTMRARIDWLASHDALTGLPNRASFVHALPGLLQRMAAGRCCVVLNLDLRRFQRLNETLGRSGGDRVLQALTERLQTLVGSAPYLLARIAGDEFALAIADLADADTATRLVAFVHARLAEPLPVLPEPVSVSVDIGCALAPHDGRDGETLLRHAVAAARHARSVGGGWYAYEAKLGQRMQRRASLERALRTAIAADELSLAYQPQVALVDERVIGVEALMRWQHPQFGAVSPAEFIPIAEETGLIRSLGAWALETACHEAAGWSRLCRQPPRVAVNLSARQFADPALMATITHALQSSGLPPARLEIEITESLLMDNPERTVSVLAALRRAGVGVAIDDFGTGYSSLSYLKTFPLDRLKIDRSFVRDVEDKADSAAIVQAIIALAHSLGLSVIAEGVEDEGQLDFLLAQDCDEVQGYLFAPPRAPAELHALLMRATPLRAGRRFQSNGVGESASNAPRA